MTTSACSNAAEPGRGVGRDRRQQRAVARAGRGQHDRVEALVVDAPPVAVGADRVRRAAGADGAAACRDERRGRVDERADAAARGAPKIGLGPSRPAGAAARLLRAPGAEQQAAVALPASSASCGTAARLKRSVSAA